MQDTSEFVKQWLLEANGGLEVYATAFWKGGYDTVETLSILDEVHSFSSPVSPRSPFISLFLLFLYLFSFSFTSGGLGCSEYHKAGSSEGPLDSRRQAQRETRISFSRNPKSSLSFLLLLFLFRFLSRHFPSFHLMSFLFAEDGISIIWTQRSQAPCGSQSPRTTLSRSIGVGRGAKPRTRYILETFNNS